MQGLVGCFALYVVLTSVMAVMFVLGIMVVFQRMQVMICVSCDVSCNPCFCIWHVYVVISTDHIFGDMCGLSLSLSFPPFRVAFEMHLLRCISSSNRLCFSLHFCIFMNEIISIVRPPIYALPFLLAMAFGGPPSTSFLLCHSSISRRTLSRYALYSSLPSSRSLEQ